jgi:hypothetical protein
MKLHVFYIIVLMVLTGCQEVWFFAVTDTTNPSRPHFRVSTSQLTPSKGLSFSIFDVNEVNRNGDIVQNMWAIRPVENKKLNQIIYGQTPVGYKEVLPPKPIEVGKFYNVHGKYHFRLVENEKGVAAEVFTGREFNQ